MADLESSQLSGLEPSSYSGIGYRNQTPGFDPRSGEGARRFGGRFNPPRSFAAIHLCTTRTCVVAELTALGQRQGVIIDDLLPREVWALTASLERVLDLGDESVRDAAGLRRTDLVLPDHAFTRQIGEAAHERGYQAIKSASATGVDEILVLFPGNLLDVALDVDFAPGGSPATTCRRRRVRPGCRRIMPRRDAFEAHGHTVGSDGDPAGRDRPATARPGRRLRRRSPAGARETGDPDNVRRATGM